MYLVLTCFLFILLFLPFLKKSSFGYKTIFTSIALFYYDFVELVLGPFLVKKYFSFFFFLFIFIFLANILGLVPFFHPITGNINVTVGLSLIVFIFYHYEGIKELGLKIRVRFDHVEALQQDQKLNAETQKLITETYTTLYEKGHITKNQMLVELGLSEIPNGDYYISKEPNKPVENIITNNTTSNNTVEDGTKSN